MRTSAFLLLLLAAAAAQAEPDLSAPEALAAVRAGKLAIVDIRTPAEWRATGTVPGAARVDLYQGAAAFTQGIQAVAKGNKNTPIGLICRTGNRTTHAQRYLQSLGYGQVYNIKEGMAGSGAGPGWIKRGLPLESCSAC